MTVQILSESTPVARKKHDCMACEFILNNGIDGNGFTRPELRAISKARKNKWQIVEGEKYTKQNNISYGDLYTFKAITAMHDICIKYDMYAD